MPTPEPATVAADLRVAMGKLARRVKQEDRIPHGQVAVLGVLDRDGAMTTSDLAADQRVRPQSRAPPGGRPRGRGGGRRGGARSRGRAGGAAGREGGAGSV
ncbi:hypothetical protein ACFWIP_40350, partial [Streptomyces anulatus]